MPALLLGPLLRHVGVDSATIWVETDGAGEVVVRAGSVSATTTTFSVFGHHYALVIVEGLEADTTVPYTVDVDGCSVWPPLGEPVPAQLDPDPAGS